MALIGRSRDDGKLISAFSNAFEKDGKYSYNILSLGMQFNSLVLDGQQISVSAFGVRWGESSSDTYGESSPHQPLPSDIIL